jgi:hypothetical protein
MWRNGKNQKEPIRALSLPCVHPQPGLNDGDTIGVVISGDAPFLVKSPSPGMSRSGSRRFPKRSSDFPDQRIGKKHRLTAWEISDGSVWLSDDELDSVARGG